MLLEDGEEVARATPPQVEAVDGTAAGDAFTACLLVSLLEGRDRRGGARRARAPRARSPRRGSARSRRCRRRPRSTRSCARLVATRYSRTRWRRRSSSTATPGTTTRSRCCSPSRARRSSCSASRPSTATRRSRRRPRTRCACSSSRAAPTSPSPPAPTGRSSRELAVAAHVHGESGLDGPALPRADAPSPSASDAVDVHRRADRAPPAGPSRSCRPAR